MKIIALGALLLLALHPQITRQDDRQFLAVGVGTVRFIVADGKAQVE